MCVWGGGRSAAEGTGAAVPTLEEHPSTWYRASEEDFLAYVGKAPGFWPVDKPAGVTSRAVVDAVWKHVGGAKAGHTGTLDPFATGVLVVAVGRALKFIRYAEEWTKEYEGTVLFGLSTDTWDATGRAIRRQEAPDVERERVESVLSEMKGYVDQPTPPVSAARYGGRRLYELAREGEFHMPKRRVRIDSMSILRFYPPRLDLRVECGRGTYIRSIAWVLGEAVGCGAVLERLRRLREGPFALRHCLPVPIA
jgi:tRNA pseudouridine55 synthase